MVAGPADEGTRPEPECVGLRLLWWLGASTAGIFALWLALGGPGRARWDTLLAPFTIPQADFLGLALLILVPWVASLWGPRLFRVLGPLAGGAAWAFWSLVVDGIGV